MAKTGIAWDQLHRRWLGVVQLRPRDRVRSFFARDVTEAIVLYKLAVEELTERLRLAAKRKDKGDE
jgi:hypothetical protein